MKDKLKVLATLVVIIAIIYAIASTVINNKHEEVEIINNNFKYTKGIVATKKVYKGRSIHVLYVVDGKKYTGIDGIGENDKVKEGDTVKIKYSVSKPELMITEFNDQY